MEGGRGSGGGEREVGGDRGRGGREERVTGEKGTGTDGGATQVERGRGGEGNRAGAEGRGNEGLNGGAHSSAEEAAAVRGREEACRRDRREGTRAGDDAESRPADGRAPGA